MDTTSDRGGNMDVTVGVPEFLWAHRYATLAWAADRLHHAATGRPLILYRGPDLSLEGPGDEPPPSATQLRSEARELLQGIAQLGVSVEVATAARRTIAAIIAVLDGVTPTPGGPGPRRQRLLVDVGPMLSAGARTPFSRRPI